MSEWIRTDEQMPDPSKKVLAYYKNEHGKGRRIIAAWVAAKTEPADSESDFGEYYEDEDEYYCPEGWYEQIENWDEYGAVHVGSTISHWMPLPAPPVVVNQSEPAEAG